MRRDKARESRIAELAAAWEDLPPGSKPDLMLGWPRLYAAAAQLAAYEYVTKSEKRR